VKANVRAIRRTHRSRIGLVLGAGGVLGAAWTAGTLAALQDEVDVDLREVDVIVGTSAGSIIAAELSCGFTVDDIVAHQQGRLVDGLPPAWAAEASTCLPPLPLPFIGSPRLLMTALLTPARLPPTVLASACLPCGRADLTVIEQFVQGLVEHADRGREPWIVAVDYDRGKRAVFGRDEAPATDLATAVSASCAIPGWYRPVRIGCRRYVDGGVWSSTSADVLVGAGLDEIYVLAPMAGDVLDAPRSIGARLERRLRRHVTRRVRREARALERDGATVHLLTPGPRVLATMGANLMDPRRHRAVLAATLRAPSRLRPAA
jgi:NTE family protein